MKKICLLLLTAAFILCQPGSVGAQNNDISGNQVYFEWGGPGITSLNFDGRFKGHSRLGMGYRFGIGAANVRYYYSDVYWGGYHEDKVTATFPLGLNYVFGSQTSNHTFEIGAGCTIFTKKVWITRFDYYEPSNFLGHVSFMYRRAPIKGGFTWRVGVTGFIADSNMLISPTLGIGYAF